MSNRSLLEINHDYAGEIDRDPAGFARALDIYLRSGSRVSVSGLERFGVRVFGMRHHSDAFNIDWGGNKASERESKK